MRTSCVVRITYKMCIYHGNSVDVCPREDVWLFSTTFKGFLRVKTYVAFCGCPHKDRCIRMSVREEAQTA